MKPYGFSLPAFLLIFLYFRQCREQGYEQASADQYAVNLFLYPFLPCFRRFPAGFLPSGNHFLFFPFHHLIRLLFFHPFYHVSSASLFPLCFFCFVSFVLFLLFCFSCFASPVLFLLFCFSCSASPVLLLLFCFFCSASSATASLSIIFTLFYHFHVGSAIRLTPT